MSGSPNIRVNDLVVRYGPRTVLDRVSLSIAGGELVGLVGPNGAGKTTLLRAILGLTESEGHIEILGNDARLMDAKSRARMFAYLAQGGAVHWPLTVESLVALGRLPHLTPWQSLSEDDQAHIDAAMEETGTLQFRERLVTQLSGGERARVLLARALASKAPFLFADEPAAALDPHYQLEMMTLLRNHVTDNTAGVVVMHDLNLAQHFCDRLVVVHEGRIVADGDPQDVLSDQLLADVFAVKAARWSEAGDSFLVPKAMMDI